MGRPRHTAEQVIGKLREADFKPTKGRAVGCVGQMPAGIAPLLDR